MKSKDFNIVAITCAYYVEIYNTYLNDPLINPIAKTEIYKRKAITEKYKSLYDKNYITITEALEKFVMIYKGKKGKY